MKKFFTVIFTIIIIICSIIIISQLVSSPQMRYKNSSIIKSESKVVQKDNNTPSSLDYTLTPSSSIYYSGDGSESSSDSSSDSTSNSDSTYDYNSSFNSNSYNDPSSNTNNSLSSIKNSISLSILNSVNASPQQIIDTVNSFVLKSGIFNDISIKLIDQNTANVDGTFTNDIDTLIDNYPGFERYKIYLKFAAGQSIYTTIKIVVDENNQLIPSFEKLYIGILPIPTGLINNKLKDDRKEFTDALKSQLE